MRLFRHTRAVLLVGLLVCNFQSGALGEDEITIGAVQAVRGVFSECFINTDAALKDIVDMTNREGGILGKKLRYVSEGTDYDVEESAQEFVKIVEESKPLVMFGNSTGLGLKLAADMGNKFKVLYSSSSFSADLAYPSRYPSIFLPGPTYGEQIGMLLGYIAKKNPDARVAFFYSDTPFGHDPIAYALPHLQNA